MELNQIASGEKRQPAQGLAGSGNQNTSAQPSAAKPGGGNVNPSATSQTHSSWQAAASSADRIREQRRSRQEQFHRDLSALLSDMEALLGRAGTLSSEALQASKEQLLEKVYNIKAQLNELGEKTSESTQHTVEIAQAYVRERPLKSLGVALGVGAFFGMMLNRHRTG